MSFASGSWASRSWASMPRRGLREVLIGVYLDLLILTTSPADLLVATSLLAVIQSLDSSSPILELMAPLGSIEAQETTLPLTLTTTSFAEVLCVN